MINRIALTIVFTLSFLSYMTPELSAWAQFVPLVLFALIVFLKVLCTESAFEAIWSLFERDGLLYVLFIALLIVAVSFASGFEKSLETAVIITVCLVLTRLYMAVVPIREVFEAFFWSGILSVAIFIPLSFAALLHSIETLTRFSILSYHPNLLAFVLAGYFCSMVWKFLVGNVRMKILTGSVGLFCLVIIFFASSRGSIVAILAGGVFIAGVAILSAGKEAASKVMQFGLLLAAALLGLFFLVQNLDWARNAYAFVDEVLAISSEYRGINTGLSGRFDQWSRATRVLSDGTWLVGQGLRSSDTLFPEDQLIDNSYLVGLYELGLIPTLLITWRFITVSYRFLMAYFRSTDREGRYFYLACGLFMTIFLFNNVVARFFFSVGNPYSLVALLFFVTPARRLTSVTAAVHGSRSATVHLLGAH